MWLTASSYIVYLRISSYIMKPFIIYDFAPDPIRISLYMRKMFFSFFNSAHGINVNEVVWGIQHHTHLLPCYTYLPHPVCRLVKSELYPVETWTGGRQQSAVIPSQPQPRMGRSQALTVLCVSIFEQQWQLKQQITGFWTFAVQCTAVYFLECIMSTLVRGTCVRIIQPFFLNFSINNNSVVHV